MKKNAFTFFYKICILSLPFSSLFIVYVYLDPFKVIYHYNSYYQSGFPCYVGLDRDYVSTQTFINNHIKYKYNSFIFGNSRSRHFEVKTWAKYIHTNHCFHFDAAAESILGINRKFKFLKNNHIKIDNALIVLDFGTLEYTKDKTSHLHLSHPVLSNKSWFDFHVKFFSTFLTPDFLFAYLDKTSQNPTTLSSLFDHTSLQDITVTQSSILTSSTIN